MAVLDVRLAKQIHPGLRIEAEFRLEDGAGVLFGPSGVGKTSLLRLIAGLDRPDLGTIRLGETVLDDVEAGTFTPLRRRRIGMVFQDDLLFPHLDVAGNVRFGLRGWPALESKPRLQEVAALCGIEHLLKRRPETLSGGERQRVGLARALAPRPRLLLCDEPVSALDESSRVGMVERLRHAREAEGIPMLYVTHASEEAVAIGDRLYRMLDGRIVAAGDPLEVIAATEAGVIGLRNVLRGRVEEGRTDASETLVRLDDGPLLTIPKQSTAAGGRITLAIRADEVLLARERPVGLSARNVVPAVVERVISGPSSSEVVARSEGTTWIISVVESAVRSLELAPGASTWMIAKARSFRVVDAGE